MFNQISTVKADTGDPDPYQGAYPVLVQTPKSAFKPSALSALYLQATDIGAFMRLQDKIRPTLEKPYHLKPRTPDDLKVHFAERQPAIGVKAPNGALAGFSLVTFLKNEEAVQNLAGYPITDMERATMAVAQTLCVDPSMKGRGISRSILDAVFQTAAQNGMTQIVSAIADDNAPSIGAFTSAGYKAFAHGTDPKQGYAKTFYRKAIECNAA